MLHGFCPPKSCCPLSINNILNNAGNHVTFVVITLSKYKVFAGFLPFHEISEFIVTPMFQLSVFRFQRCTLLLCRSILFQFTLQRCVHKTFLCQGKRNKVVSYIVGSGSLTAGSWCVKIKSNTTIL